MKTNKYFTSDRRAEYLRVKNDKEKEKEKEDDNEENEEEEEEEEEDEKNKANTHAQKSFPGSRQPINKEIKSTIVKREEKSRLLNQVPNSFKQRVIYQQNQENESSSKEGSSIRRALQEKKTQPITAASRILAKKENIRTGPSQPYTIKLSQNSPRGQLKVQNSQNILPPVLKAQNSQAQLQVKSRIPTKIETQSQAPLYQSKYSRRILESSVNNEESK